MTLDNPGIQTLTRALLDSVSRLLDDGAGQGDLIQEMVDLLVREEILAHVALYRCEPGRIRLRTASRLSGDQRSPISSRSDKTEGFSEEALLRCAQTGQPHLTPPVFYFPFSQKNPCDGVLAIVPRSAPHGEPDIPPDLSDIVRLLSLVAGIQESMGRLGGWESRFRTLLDALPSPLFLLDGRGTLLEANASGRAFLGPDFLPGQTLPPFLSGSIPVAHSRLSRRLSRLTSDDSSTKRDKESEFVRNPENGREDQRTLSVSRHRVPNRAEVLVRLESLDTNPGSREIVERYRLLFEKAREGIVITDRARIIVDVNPSFTQVTGYTRGEILGKSPSLLKSGRQTPEFYARMWEALSRDGHWEGEIWDRKKSGELYCEWLSIYSLETNGEVTHYLGIFTDITEHMKDQDRILHLASHDVLTDLPNRRIFKERIEEAHRRSLRSKEKFAVGILDLDGFKSVNDRLGHQGGDLLLVSVAARLGSVLRQTDTLARLGGDEFGLLLDGLADSDLPDLLTRIVESLHTPLLLGEEGAETVSISGSLGVTLSPPDTGSPDTLLTHADLALYRVKDQGKDGWSLFERHMAESLAERHRIRNEFERAIDRGELLLHFQPQVHMTKGELLGLEALVRWNHPERGLLFPGAFIDTVESTPLIAKLGRTVLDMALAWQNKWLAQGLFLRISVNVGARHFLSGSFLDDLDLILSRHIPGQNAQGRVTLEITETETLRDLLLAQRMSESCQERGILLSLDDFGTGQASLTSLQKMTVGEIKIDQGFIRKIRSREKDRAIVQSLLAAGRMMGIDVVAEGVETEEDGRTLIDMGCRRGQGYAISRPLPPESVPDWVRGWRLPASWKIASPD